MNYCIPRHVQCHFWLTNRSKVNFKCWLVERSYSLNKGLSSRGHGIPTGGGDSGYGSGGGYNGGGGHDDRRGEHKHGLLCCVRPTRSTVVVVVVMAAAVTAAVASTVAAMEVAVGTMTADGLRPVTSAVAPLATRR
eukprot:3420675-Pyramimonas_sp.AAC.1